MLMLPDFRVRQRDFLLEISRAITAQLDLGEVLRRVLNASVAMMAGQNGLIALRAPDNHFYVRAISGIDSTQIEPLNQKLHLLLSKDDQLPQQERQDGFNAVLREMATLIDPTLEQSIALPLVFAGEPVGLLIVFRSYLSTVTPNDLQVLQSFADQAAIAVHNAQLYEKIDQERMRLAAILDYSADGVLILGADLTILHFNRALERMTGWKADEAIGMDHHSVIRWRRADSRTIDQALADGWPHNAENPAHNTLYVEGDLQAITGLTLSVGITYAPMLTAENHLTNIVANIRDITHWRQAQEMQNVFISGISHELKTPVAIIKGYAATLRREDATWDARIIRENLGVIEDEADRLTDLIQNLLTASKLQAQRELTLDLGEVWLNALAHQVTERFRSQSHKHTLTLAFDPDFPPIQGDEIRLRQVLDNLVNNAIKYSPTGGTITVGGDYDDRQVTIYVRDEGEGISERDQLRIFERFYRVDSKLSRRTQGTGLGLYLARAIIQAHHGVIGVESTLGKGAVFHFTLPQKQEMFV
ncbi:MAG: PAS domain S-box protein [Armatimonadetes bacterium]|nr:PAS domain S-box protein [Anaerolineae bacterium]